MWQERGPKKGVLELRAELNLQAPEVTAAQEVAPPHRDVEAASFPKPCPVCGGVIELAAGPCAKCSDPRPFKPYSNNNSPAEKEVYEKLVQAFSAVGPGQRPWCGLGAKVDFLAVSPTDVTVAVIREMGGVQKGVVHVSRNWREAWEVETVDGEKRLLQDNPCEQAEQAIRTIKHSLESVIKADDEELFPRIKCLIIFPDGHDFDGPKDFSIVQGLDEVMTLNLRSLDELPNAIRAGRGERLDSRKYRKWIESSILGDKDDSILGTWLDPAFDSPAAELPKCRWLGYIGREATPVEKEKPLRPEDSRPAMRSLVKVTAMVVTGMTVGMVGWRTYHAASPIHAIPYSYSASPARPENFLERSKAVQLIAVQDEPSLPENEKREAVAVRETPEADDAPKVERTAEKQPIENAKKPRARTQAGDDSTIKRQKIGAQINNAILRRAISGVTVRFVGETAHLEGRVDTENQKSAAEKAARSVRGVEEVSNSIEVTRLPPADG